MNATPKSSTLTWSILLLGILIVVTLSLSFYTDSVALGIQRDLIEVAHELPPGVNEMVIDQSFFHQTKLSIISTAQLGIAIFLAAVLGEMIRKHNK